MNLISPRIITVTLAILLTTTLASQPDKSKREQIQAQKVAYITTKLDLTSQEAEKFWPVYNEHDKLKMEVVQSFGRSERIDKIDIDSLSDEEATKLANDQIIMSQKLLDLRKEYYVKYKSILPIKKVLKLYQAEKEFQRELLERIKRQGQRGGK